MINLEFSNKWQITRSKTLDGVDIFQHYPVAEKAVLPESENEYVEWDQFKIHTVDQKRLYSKDFGPCLALAVRGYDESGKMSHIGLAHINSREQVYIDFLQKVREAVKGRIELFIAGGAKETTFHINEIWESWAKELKMEVMHDVSKRFFKRIALSYNDKTYRGSTGIAQLYFDREFNLRIEVDLEMTELERLEEVTSEKACELKVMPEDLFSSIFSEEPPARQFK